ncbi:hypothetical protein [Acinetobacter sp. DSM 11652]|uniref:hypothetical protein n=1 Tax=Acinetobacter sp. DSM 11652 TaxID=346222 RepID=UPI0008B058A6|nr:hypothetical protein [Acinetobacter sp. DSM 11652]SEL91623.1 hypothetical protein SAMN05216500_107159 [Acinetobacter sp. DSM 11652]
MILKKISYIFFVLILAILILYLALLYKFKSIDSRFQLESSKVLISFFLKDFYLFGGLEKQSLEIERKNQKDQDDFYYSIIILGSKNLEYNGGGLLLLNELLSKRDNTNLILKIKKFKNSKGYESLNKTDKDSINYWENILLENNSSIRSLS